MPEGTLIPPRDPHARDAQELIAPVIPFRQRGAQPEAPIADDREADIAIVAGPADEPASNWIAEGSHLLAHDAIPQTLSEDAAQRPRRTRLLFAAAIALALGVLAAAAFAVVVVAGGIDPGPGHVTANPPTSGLSRTVADTPRVKAATRAHARAATTKATTHPRRVARRGSSRPARPAALAARGHRPSPIGTQAAARSSTPAVLQTTPVEHKHTTSGQTATAGSSAASSCVPGELGC